MKESMSKFQTPIVQTLQDFAKQEIKNHDFKIYLNYKNSHLQRFEFLRCKLTTTCSVSSKNRRLTEKRAASGHS